MERLYKQVDHLLNQVLFCIDERTKQYEVVLENSIEYENKIKEIKIKIEEIDKILSLYTYTADTHTLFSPLDVDKDKSESYSVKNAELLRAMSELKDTEEKYKECMELLLNYKTQIQQLQEFHKQLIELKKSFDQVKEDEKNLQYVKDVKDIYQKRHLINLLEHSNDDICHKLNSEILTSLDDHLISINSILQIIDSDRQRAKLELNQALENLVLLEDNFKELLENNGRSGREDRPLCEVLNSYLGELNQIYSDVKFTAKAINLQQLNNINLITRRIVLGIFKGIYNSILLHSDPKVMAFQFAYLDGSLIVKGEVVGRYINFYNEMKNSPNSVVANLYEKVFLLHGDIKFQQISDKKFIVELKTPLESYLI